MNIDEFYDADPRRRTSEELQFGMDWHDAHGRRYELNWVTDTGELYVMQDDLPPVWTDPFGDFIVEGVPAEDLGVRVLKLLHSESAVKSLLAGWEAAMPRPDSIAWLIERLGAGGPS